MGWAGTSESVFGAMLAEWRSIPRWNAASDLDSWETTLAVMRQEMLELRGQGRWRSGGLTLLHQLGLHHDEVMLCRGLAWLLTPDGWHGLGEHFLRDLLHLLGLSTAGLGRATVSLEEARGTTRADLVLRYPGGCVLVEAKDLAGEQPGQADRLAAGWAEEDPRLVFLTPEGREPLTAVATAGRWSCLRWSDLASIGTNLAGGARADVAPGALELLETWKHYGGCHRTPSWTSTSSTASRSRSGPPCGKEPARPSTEPSWPR